MPHFESLIANGELETASELYLHEFGTDYLSHPNRVPDQNILHLLLSGYANKGDVSSALELYNEMVSLSIRPTIETFKILISAGVIKRDISIYERVEKERKTMRVSMDQEYIELCLTLFVEARNTLYLQSFTRRGLKMTGQVPRLLLELYGIAEDFEKMVQTFNRTPQVDSEIVESLIKFLCQVNQVDVVLALLDRFAGINIPENKVPQIKQPESTILPNSETIKHVVDTLIHRGQVVSAQEFLFKFDALGAIASPDTFKLLVDELNAQEEFGLVEPLMRLYTERFNRLPQHERDRQRPPTVGHLQSELELALKIDNLYIAFTVLGKIIQLGSLPSFSAYSNLIESICTHILEKRHISSSGSNRMKSVLSILSERVHENKELADNPLYIHPHDRNHNLLPVLIQLYTIFRHDAHRFPNQDSLEIHEKVLRTLCRTGQVNLAGSVFTNLILDGISPTENVVCELAKTMCEIIGWSRYFRYYTFLRNKMIEVNQIRSLQTFLEAGIDQKRLDTAEIELKLLKVGLAEFVRYTYPRWEEEHRYRGYDWNEKKFVLTGSWAKPEFLKGYFEAVLTMETRSRDNGQRGNAVRDEEMSTEMLLRKVLSKPISLVRDEQDQTSPFFLFVLTFLRYSILSRQPELWEFVKQRLCKFSLEFPLKRYEETFKYRASISKEQT